MYGKPGNSGENSNETVRPGGKFSGKKEYLSRYYLFPILTENFLTEEDHLFGLPVPGLMSRESEKFTGIL